MKQSFENKAERKVLLLIKRLQMFITVILFFCINLNDSMIIEFSDFKDCKLGYHRNMVCI